MAGTYTARVQEDFRSGARGGVNGTPTLFINGVRYEGPPDTGALLDALADASDQTHKQTQQTHNRT